MHLFFLLALLPAALVTVVPGPEDGCPSTAQIQASLERHAPRLVATRADDDPSSLLSLNLASAQPGRELTFSLLDTKGRVRLYRSLPPSPSEKARSCAALADTIAFIVDRYFDEVAVPALPEKKPPPPPSPPAPLPLAPPVPPAVARTGAPPAPPLPPAVARTGAPPAPPAVARTGAPPAPPALPPEPRAAKPEPKSEPKAEAKPEAKPEPKPKREPKLVVGSDIAPRPPSFTLSVSGGRRTPGAAEDLGGIEFKLSLGVDLRGLGSRGRLWTEVSGGIIGYATKSWDYQTSAGRYRGNASAVRSGADLAFMFGWPAWRGRLYIGPLTALEIVWLEGVSNGQIQREIRTGLAAGIRGGYQLVWRQRFFARADFTGCAALIRQRVATQSNTNTPLFEAPPAYAVFSFGIGIWF